MNAADPSLAEPALSGDGDQGDAGRELGAGGILRWALGRCSSRARFGFFATLALTLAARLGGLAAAGAFWFDTGELALLLGLGAAGLWLARGVVSSLTYHEAERDLTVAAARAWLAADVLAPPKVEPHAALWNGVHGGASALSGALPSLGADLLATLLGLVLLWLVLPTQVLLGCALLVSLVIGLTLLLRGRVERLHDSANQAFERVALAMTTTLDGRLDLVTAARESVMVQRLDRASLEYRKSSRKVALGAVLWGRAPLALAALLASLWIFAPALSGAAAEREQAFGTLLVLGTALPPMLGMVFYAQEVLRLKTRLAPFASLVLGPSRGERAHDTGAERAHDTGAEHGAEHAYDTGAERVPSTAPAIRFERVRFRYAAGAAPTFEAASLEHREGLLLIEGPNGAGKSTALWLMLGLRAPEAGTVSLFGHELTLATCRAVRRRIAYLPQRAYLGEPQQSVREAFDWLTPGAGDAVLLRALERVGLLAPLSVGTAPLTRTLGSLSGGQRQRLALARVLVQDAELVLLDEPDANLDHEGLALLERLIEELLAGGAIVVLAAHGALAAPTKFPTAQRWTLPR